MEDNELLKLVHQGQQLYHLGTHCKCNQVKEETIFQPQSLTTRQNPIQGMQMLFYLKHIS